jgi:hypothetical protein
MQTGTKVGIVDDAGGGTVRMIDLKLVFEDHFAGKYAELLEWLKFSLEVNFGPLPVALGNVIRGATALSSSTRPPASTGSPGGSSSPPA